MSLSLLITQSVFLLVHNIIPTKTAKLNIIDFKIFRLAAKLKRKNRGNFYKNHVKFVENIDEFSKNVQNFLYKV